MKNTRRLWIYVLVILVLTVALFFMFKDKGVICKWRSGDSVNSTQNECVKIQTSCCPCNNGGEEKCVLKSDVEKYNESLKNCPAHGELICATYFNCKIKSCEYDFNKKECTDVPLAL